jgi:hypothetical protein
MNYFHLSPTKNKQSILNNGLKSNGDGEIYFFTSITQENNIVTNQLMLSEYSLFEISSKGFIGDIIEDDVADVGSDAQIILIQDLVSPQYIKHISDKEINLLESIEENEYQKFMGMGLSEEQYVDIIKSIPERLAIYNKRNNTNY